MAANDSKSHLSYLNKVVDQYNNTYHHSIIKKNLLMLIIVFWLKKLRLILKFLNLELMTESGLLSIGTFLVKITLKIVQEKYFLLILFWKLILGLIKLKI